MKGMPGKLRATGIQKIKSLVFAGFVTAFSVQSDLNSNLTLWVALSIRSWVPSQEFTSFSKAIVGRIELQDVFFGPNF
jgi:hypothetical protein